MTWEAGADGEDLEKTITIPILGDNEDEQNGTFYLKLSNPQNIELGNRRSVITITDDDDSSFTPPPGGRPLASLIFDRDRVEVNEGERAIYWVRTANDRGADMIVNLRSTNPQLMIESARLVFATINWLIFQTVTVSATAEAADHNEAGAIMYSIPATDDFVRIDNAGLMCVSVAHTYAPEPETALACLVVDLSVAGKGADRRRGIVGKHGNAAKFG